MKTLIINLKKIILSLFIITALSGILRSQNKTHSISNNYTPYKQEIKELFENHYGNEFINSPEMKTACIDYIKRKIDEKPETNYQECNYFITRRFKKSIYETNEYISKDDILLADYRIEFIQSILNNPKFQMVNADKINVEIGEYREYFYVVVGVTTTWYENNPDKWVFEKIVDI